MTWKWSVEGDGGITHIWAASAGEEPKTLFSKQPSLVYYWQRHVNYNSALNTWETDHVNMLSPWSIHGPPNGDGHYLPSQWEMA